MSSVVLQNSVRVRIFLILAISICIRLIRPLNSTPVHKMTSLLAYNYILYGIVTLCTLIPLKTAWIIATGSLGLACLLGGVCLLMGLVSVSRCLSGEQVGCVQSAPADVSTLVLVALTLGLDVLQTWSAYRILRFPSFVASATQRIRVLFCWALPFGWLVNIVLWSNETALFWPLARLFIDPSLIFLSSTKDKAVLCVLMALGLVCDCTSLLQIEIELARWGLFATIGLTVAGLLMILASGAKTKNVKAVPVAEKVVEVKKADTSGPLRNRKKSQENQIAF